MLMGGSYADSLIRLYVVRQGFRAVSGRSDGLRGIPGAPSTRQRGGSVALLGRIQKQGSAEAVPVREKRQKCTLFLTHSIAY